MKKHQLEVEEGNRFQFGSNWMRFLEVLNDDRIAIAEASLKDMLGVDDLKGRRFLDAGSGSGLFSLVARRLGAHVHSFDYDPQSVACTEELRRRYFTDDEQWVVEEGSVLDENYMAQLGQFDVVYSWGVLHHTGAMWQALENITSNVSEGGQIFLAIYNHQGGPTRRWMYLKKAYNQYKIIRLPLAVYTLFRQWTLSFLRDMLDGRPLHSWINYKKNRGMSPWLDVVDWIGGYPFEAAKPEEIFDFYRNHDFSLKRLKTCAGGVGCNEFVFLNKQN